MKEAPETQPAAAADLPARTARATATLVAFAASGLARRRGKALALVASLALTVALGAAVLFLTDSLRAAAARTRDAAPDLVVQRLVAGRPATLAANEATQLTELDGVRSVRSRVWGYVFLPAVQANAVVVADAPAAPPIANALTSGRALAARGEVIVGTGLARGLGLALGDQLLLPPTGARPAPPLRVVGVFAESLDTYAADLLLVVEADARAILGLKDGEATDLAIDLTNREEARVVTKNILERIEGARVVDRALAARTHELAFGRRSGLALFALLAVLASLLVLASDRLASLGAEERREIGVLKAVGFSTSDVLTLRVAESTILALVGTTVGVTLAYTWVFVFGAPGLRAAIAGFGVLNGELALVPTVDAAQLAALTLGVAGPFVALSLVPAWRAAMTDPMDAMRGG